MEAVLGSLYSGEIELGVDNVVSVLATAALLQVQHVVDECSKTMKENISCKTIAVYYNAATAYGANSSVIKSAREWLEANLIWHSGRIDSSDTFYKNISVELMKEIVSSPNLIVFGTELDILRMLLKWLTSNTFYIYYKIIIIITILLSIFLSFEKKSFHRCRLAVHVGKLQDETRASVFIFFQRILFLQRSSIPLLSTEEGAKYKSPFKSLRMDHLLSYNINWLKTNLKGINIFPHQWMNSCYEKLWQSSYLIPLHKDLG